eukprot:COSAG02_NODE_50507_length_320_cov_0.683258_1_plen_73_part_01
MNTVYTGTLCMKDVARASPFGGVRRSVAGGRRARGAHPVVSQCDMKSRLQLDILVFTVQYMDIPHERRTSSFF